MSNKAKSAKKPTRNDRTLNIGVAAAQASAMRLVANDLLVSINQLESGEGQGLKLFGYSISAILLRAFATELMLKVLSSMKTGKYRKDKDGHNLRMLYNDLDCETKQLINELEDKHGIKPLEQILEKHKNDFVDWRYIGQPDGMQAHFWDLDKALFILTEVFNSLLPPDGNLIENPRAPA